MHYYRKAETNLTLKTGKMSVEHKYSKGDGFVLPVIYVCRESTASSTVFSYIFSWRRERLGD